MRRSLISILVITLLIMGLGLGEMAWMRLNAIDCRDWQNELQKRVESYARMHLPDPAPQVQVQSGCGHSFVADALYFRWHKLLWRMGLRDVKPLDDADLRLASTRDLMQHPDMGTIHFLVRFDAALSSEIRKRVESVLQRYLLVQEPRQKLEFRRVKKLPELPAAQGSVLALAPPPLAVRPFHPPLFPAPEPQLKPSLIKSGNAVISVLLLVVTGLLAVQLIQQVLRSRKRTAQATAPEPKVQPNFGILAAPRVARDLGERARELWRLLQQLDPQRAQRCVLHYAAKDRESLLHFLGWLDSSTQESMLACLGTEQLLLLTDGSLTPLPPREAQQAALRFLLDLARELGSLSQLAAAPLFLHLMSKREWQRVAQQLTRPRRRALAELLDKERAGWLRGRQDLHPGWFQGGAKEAMSADQLIQRVRATLQADADQLRDQLAADRDALQVIDSYFADLTLDSSLNSDLMMLVLGASFHRQVGFGRLVERRDSHLDAALQNCEDQQIALLAYDCDLAIKEQLFTMLGERAERVAVFLRSMEGDKSHGKSLRMQARSLQRFMERQVLVADLLCVDDATMM